MRITKFLVVAIIAGLFSINANAQTDHLAVANLAYEAQEYYKAITLLKKAYSKEKDKANKAEIIYKTAECYRYVNDMKQAETWYRKALKLKYPEDKIQLYYAEALTANGKFEDVIVEYEKYAELVPTDPRGKNGAEACALAQKWIDNPSRYVVENEVQLNGKYMDFAASYASQTTKKFTSRHQEMVRQVVILMVGQVKVLLMCLKLPLIIKENGASQSRFQQQSTAFIMKALLL